MTIFLFFSYTHSSNYIFRISLFFPFLSPKWLLRNEEKNFLWVLARSFHCSLFHLAFDDIDHLPHALTNESENLYVNTIGKLFFFLSFFLLSSPWNTYNKKNIKLFSFLLGFKKDFVLCFSLQFVYCLYFHAL